MKLVVSGTTQSSTTQEPRITSQTYQAVALEPWKCSNNWHYWVRTGAVLFALHLEISLDLYTSHVNYWKKHQEQAVTPQIFKADECFGCATSQRSISKSGTAHSTSLWADLRLGAPNLAPWGLCPDGLKGGTAEKAKEIPGWSLTLCGSSKKSLNLLGREYFFTSSSSTTHGAFSQVPARSALCRMKYRRISLLGGRSVRTKLSAGTLLMILGTTDRQAVNISLLNTLEIHIMATRSKDHCTAFCPDSLLFQSTLGKTQTKQNSQTEMHKEIQSVKKV